MSAAIDEKEGQAREPDEIIPPVRKRFYSEAEIGIALALLDSNGGNVLKTARALSMPRRTLYEWATGRRNTGAVLHIRHEKTAELAKLWEDVTEMVLESITPDEVAKASLKDKGIFAGIGTEKRQLLHGQPTQITARERYERAVDELWEDYRARGEVVTREVIIMRVIELIPDAGPHLKPLLEAKSEDVKQS